jgi:hypothetical protein
MLAAIDLLLFAAHAALTLFNLAGWLWRPARRLHLAVISLTLLSWFGLGIWWGWGYCPLTDWHWQVKQARGESPLPASWIKYHLDLWTGSEWNAWAVDAAVLLCALAAFAVSAWLNLRPVRRAVAA